jgi:hypothetical protein
MKRRIWLAGALVILLWATPAKADTGVIVRTSNLPALQALCGLPTTPCTVVRTLDGTLGQLFLVTTPLPLQTFLGLLNPLVGFVGAEADQLLNLVVGLNVVPTPLNPALMSSNGDRTPVVYPAGSTTTAWNSYVNQPAASVVEVQNAQNQFHATGSGIVADIDTGVDPNHPALQGVLLPGYDFTRNQPLGSEMTDVTSVPTPSCTTTCPGPVQVNQSSAAILDQSSAAILDTNPQYAAFGHGTMVMGIIHLVAPTVQLLPLKAFKSDGTANLSDILRAIYYAAQNSANVINMSFDTKTSSTELKNALDYANQLGLIGAASAGNDGAQEIVYPAALQSDVMGVASVGSTSSTDGTRSSFSNFGNSIVWVAAPGEQIVTTYPFSTYAAGWGTSFSAPFVSGGAALLRSLATTIRQSGAASAVAHAAPLTDPNMGKGRLDLVPALQSISGTGGSPDYSVSAGPSSQTIAAGQTANFTASVEPQGGFNQTVTWSCAGAPTAATCSISPSSVTLDGTHAATATVTLTTMARGSAPPLLLPRLAPPTRLWVLWAAGFASLAVFLLVCNFGRRVRLRPGLAAAAGVLAVSLWTYSCGNFGNGGGPGSPTLTGVSVSPSSVTGGSSSTGTVTLDWSSVTGASSGVNVSLSSSASAATVPASVFVDFGRTSATFTVNTKAVTASTSATITATLGTMTKTAVLTVTPGTGGTPAGTYTLTLTGTSGNLSHSSTVQVTVN